jgi:hypothetical protein
MVPSVSDALRSARIKLARANLHTSTAQRETTRFFKNNPGPIFGVEVEGDADTPREIGGDFWSIITVTTGLPDLPDSYGARFGDAIHNYRCVLDHVAWQLVRHGSKPNLKRREQQRVQFPIYPRRADFDAECESRLPGVASTPIEFIKACHRYQGRQATNDTLLSLKDLSNDDKHRTLKPVVTAIARIEHNFIFERCLPLEYLGPDTAPPMKAGAEIGRLRCRILADEPEVTMKLKPSGRIALDDGRNMFTVLKDIRAEVTTILNAPEIAAAVR